MMILSSTYLRDIFTITPGACILSCSAKSAPVIKNAQIVSSHYNIIAQEVHEVCEVLKDGLYQPQNLLNRQINNGWTVKINVAEN